MPYIIYSYRTLLVIFTAIILSLSAPEVPAQQPTGCQLKVEQLPEIRGFKLGMTLQDIQRRHPKFKVPAPDASGYSELLYSVSYYQSYGEDSLISEDDREGLLGIKVAFLDGKLVMLRVVYDDSVKWNDVTEFLQAMDKTLKLPNPSVWSRVDDNTMRVNCEGVSLQARLETSYPAGPSLTFAQHGIVQIRRDRARAAEEKKKQDFKP